MGHKMTAPKSGIAVDRCELRARLNQAEKCYRNARIETINAELLERRARRIRDDLEREYNARRERKAQ